MAVALITNCDSCTEMRLCGIYYAYGDVFYWCWECDEVGE